MTATMPAEMGTVYAAYQQDPLGDDMQAHDTYAPAPDVNFMSQNPSGMNIYGALPQFYWGQWPPTEDASFAESTNMTAPNVFAQEESRYNYPYDPETSTQWDSPATSTHSYPVPSPATDPTSVDIPVGDTESRRSSSSKESDKQKRKRSTTKPTASKSTRRTSTKAIKQETAPKSLRIAEAKPSQLLNLQNSLLPSQTTNSTSAAKASNRVASNKFRVKKREDAKKLQADKENMEQTNRKLLSAVSDLTQQVYELKMKLLQHTDCDCRLIQEHIAKEASQYIHNSGSDNKQQTTAPRPPRYLHQYQ
ncbi:uncharacterized protein FTOL_13781 [Fusarium torulosum]|uniref:BZIP domain-containing protein n=1 Tax=Fusarium torulosum TaxID=33205 RepID=A0AAE8MMZ6_9HYPO|nr:uncharacterized protein FTOL_13781 [Fusarium torulosum]